MAKERKTDELDTETTFADMNVDGFRWYDPNRKNGKKNAIGKVTRKEYWAMVKGAFSALLPFLGCLLVGFGLVFLLIMVWLR